MKITQNTFKANLNKETLDQLLKYFNEIYEVNELGQHEFNIIYLAWLIGEGNVKYNLGEIFYDKEKVDLNEDDYEISFEAESGAGFNYELLDSYYMFDRIAEILKAEAFNKEPENEDHKQVRKFKKAKHISPLELAKMLGMEEMYLKALKDEKKDKE